MRLRAHVLLSLGTILATLGGARLPVVEWSLVAVGAAVLVAGGVLHRLDARKQREAGASSSGTSAAAEVEMLRAVSAEVERLCEEAPALSLEDLADRLAALEPRTMGPLGESIPHRIAAMGGERFAEVFGDYAAGERLVHRAWSAAADGHRPEALRALEAGARRIRAALAALDATAWPQQR